MTVEGLLYYPLDYQAGKRYPLVVQTHGGPQASDKFGFGGGQNYVPVLAEKGYAVLQPNYRGSTGYGDDFLARHGGALFPECASRCTGGRRLSDQDGHRRSRHMVKMGWSGGGHMTNKIITVTTRFKAASSGAGAADWVSMYAQSDVRSYRTPWFGGTPWQKDAPINAYWDNSPLKDVWKVTTPTIFLVGRKRRAGAVAPIGRDVPRAEEQRFPTHLYIAPREPHGWEELRHVLFKMNVELDWFEKYAMQRSMSGKKPRRYDGHGSGRKERSSGRLISRSDPMLAVAIELLAASSIARPSTCRTCDRPRGRCRSRPNPKRSCSAFESHVGLRDARDNAMDILEDQTAGQAAR